jgi:DUF971 family protein
MNVASIEIAEDGRELIVVTSDGRRHALAADLLWAECPSAAGRIRRIRGLDKRAPDPLRITAVREIGAYGVNIAFSDGHDRGIYPWTYLRTLAARPRLEDFLSD